MPPVPVEPTDELGLPWDEWADGRVWRLVKGSDFFRPSQAVQEAAKNAARRLDKVVRTVEEIRHGRAYLWVQFVDYEVVLGDPCPCGNPDLLRVNLGMATCPSCDSTVALLKPKRERQPTGTAYPGDGSLLEFVAGAPAEEAQQPKRRRRLAERLTRVGRTSAPDEASRPNARQQRKGQAVDRRQARLEELRRKIAELEAAASPEGESGELRKARQQAAALERRLARSKGTPS